MKSKLFAFICCLIMSAVAKPQINIDGTNKLNRIGHVDLSNKTVLVLNGVVEAWKMQDLAKHLGDDDVIHLVINSPGGSVAAGLMFINELESRRNQGDLKELHCYINDMAASMAAVISSYCDTVSIHKFGFIMIHEASYGCEGAQSEIKTCVDFAESWLGNIAEDVAANYGLTKKAYLKFQGRERYLTAKDSVGYGMADKVFKSIYHRGYEPAAPENMFRILFSDILDFYW